MSENDAQEKKVFDTTEKGNSARLEALERIRKLHAEAYTIAEDCGIGYVGLLDTLDGVYQSSIVNQVVEYSSPGYELLHQHVNNIAGESDSVLFLIPKEISETVQGLIKSVLFTHTDTRKAH